MLFPGGTLGPIGALLIGLTITAATTLAGIIAATPKNRWNLICHLLLAVAYLSLTWSFAEDQGVRIAGRDGSTGQTMIKVTLSELFARRGLATEAWYSSNLIGNHDGLVLSTPEYGVAKIADKRNVLPMDGDYNVVDIRYMPHWGDRKESWDAGELKSWLGGSVSIRINWRGSDSELAAPLVVDIARLLGSSAANIPPGFVPALGFFFKRPFLRETWSLSQRWSELIDVFV
jgi:myo-inositol-1-phosphate synthase